MEIRDKGFMFFWLVVLMIAIANGHALTVVLAIAAVPVIMAATWLALGVLWFFVKIAFF